MPTKQQEQAMEQYALLMEELKLRHDAAQCAVEAQLPIEVMFAREFAFLQIRMMCELLAVGCLTVHGDIPATRAGKLQSAWKADFIIEQLGNLHPDFYPRPVVKKTFTVTGKIRNHHHIEPVKSGYLTKSELANIYGRSGDVLHKGNIKKLGKIHAIDNMNDAANILGKFRILLNEHVISCLDGNTIYLCGMNEVKTGKVHWAIAEVQ